MIWVTQSNTLKLELKNYAVLALSALSPPIVANQKKIIKLSIKEKAPTRFER